MKLIITLILLAGCQSNNPSSGFVEDTHPNTKVIKAGTSYTGKDYQGKEKTCKHSPDVMCTMQVTPQSEYARECESKGFKVVTCDCHDYICLEN